MWVGVEMLQCENICYGDVFVLSVKFMSWYYVYVKVVEGCNYICVFCIIFKLCGL